MTGLRRPPGERFLGHRADCRIGYRIGHRTSRRIGYLITGYPKA